MKNRNNTWLFLLGLFSLTQVSLIGNIGISEIIVALLFPVVFIKDIQTLRREGILTVVWLCLLSCVGCCVSSAVNHTRLIDFLRGFASPYMLAAGIVVIARLMRGNIDGYKWLLVGIALSGVINIFAFQYGAEMDLTHGEVDRGLGAVDSVTGYSLFLQGHIAPVIKLPVNCWYLHTPLAYSIIVPLVITFYSVLTTSSGRSSLALGLLSALMITIGGKTAARMKLIQKHFALFCVIAVIAAAGIKAGYKLLATGDYLTEAAVQKYEAQTRGGSSLLSILMSGRAEFFVGLIACMDRPIGGFGPWALDHAGYYEDFLMKYGAPEDYMGYLHMKAYAASIGMGGKVPLLRTHSYIISFWCWYGILGLPLWLYVLYIVYSVLKNYLASIPVMYGFLCLSIPGFVWNIFFSPFGGRMTQAAIILCLLLARGVGRRQIPYGYGIRL